MAKEHQYTVTTNWTGNTGTGTRSYQSYERNYVVSVENKPAIPGSSDPSFRGDRTRYNPEELLVASLSTCHMLWYLHLCAEAGVVVTDCVDKATGIMIETPDGSGRFTEVTLHPTVTVADASMIAQANALHEPANRKCFIANSCNFPVHHQPVCLGERH
ncbi:OsmC family protein [Spirosoma sp. KUDC1026]|uniref:OsmC family protein n=1 Tax=Spirosoma sp. KUDC1026 TaxID=2745947 RepID=UPI00159BEC1C|nr:OsmC family protein [Spirosoma sp. KUDC1026]QKZ14968.1 OsmC family protein [Spirosoma sp. KUDC1026]